MVSAKAAMVDIGDKRDVMRIAKAAGQIRLRRETIDRILENRVEKGDVLTNAKLAAISAIKKTPEIILLAHPIPILAANVNFNVDRERSLIWVEVEVKSVAKTGVEMEALTGVATALLSIFDLCKQYEKDEKGEYPTAEISGIKVIQKIKEE